MKDKGRPLPTRKKILLVCLKFQNNYGMAYLMNGRLAQIFNTQDAELSSF